MPTFVEFCSRTKMRHDFSDQIQVRYQHTDGEAYDTWVSGEEALQRLKSTSREAQLRGLSKLDWQKIREAQQRLPEEGKRRLRDELQQRLGDGIEDLVGGNVIGDSLSAAARGEDLEEDPAASEKRRWQAQLRNDAFYAQILALAWIQLRGSFPDENQQREMDDWL